MLQDDAAKHAEPQQAVAEPQPVELLHDSHAETQQAGTRFQPVEVLQGDPAVAQRAGEQVGVVTRDDLRDAGLSRGAIAHRIAQERLHRQHRGTYLVGHDVPPEFAPYVAAALALGDDAYVDHRSALVLYDVLDPTPGEDIHVLVIGACRRSRDGIKVHRTTRIGEQDIGVLDGIVPIVSPARAILDYVADARPAELARVVNQAQVKGLVTPDDLRDILARTPGRQGAPLLKAVLARHDGPTKFRSGGERIVLALLNRARLPKPEVNGIAEGREIDFLYRDPKVAIELDGGATHGIPAAVDNDRRKDAYMRSKGYVVLRYSWWQIEEEPEAVLAEIAATLAARTRSS
jgi:very-short-patch-repair endonuclease